MALERYASGGDAASVEFSVRDCFAVDVSERTGCRLELLTVQGRSDGRSLLVFGVTGAEPVAVRDESARAATVERSWTIDSDGPGGILQVVYAGADVTTTLADVGAIAERVTASGGEGRVLALVPPDATVREVVETVTSHHPDASVRACRRTESHESEPRRATPERLLDRLSPRQREAVRVAHEAGYYEWPREAGAEECATKLGVSQPTFSEHLRAGERKLIDALLDGDDATGLS